MDDDWEKRFKATSSDSSAAHRIYNDLYCHALPEEDPPEPISDCPGHAISRFRPADRNEPAYHFRPTRTGEACVLYPVKNDQAWTAQGRHPFPWSLRIERCDVDRRGSWVAVHLHTPDLPGLPHPLPRVLIVPGDPGDLFGALHTVCTLLDGCVPKEVP